MSDIYAEKQIAKELSLAVVEKLQLSYLPNGQGADVKKIASDVGTIFEIIHTAVKNSKT